MAELRTDYKDQLLDSSVNTKRKYDLVDESGNIVAQNVSFEDKTVYSQNGDTFGAAEVNKIHEELNGLNESLSELIIVQECEQSVTISANGVKSGSFNYTIPTGYDVLSMTLRCGSAYIMPYATALSKGDFNARNFSNESKTITIAGRVAFIKSEYVSY